jgi:hypothetical protein
MYPGLAAEIGKKNSHIQAMVLRVLMPYSDVVGY